MLADSAGFDLIGRELGKDLRSAIRAALVVGAVFHEGKTPLQIFRATLTGSIRNIESHPRGQLFQEFLTKGPYFRDGDIPAEVKDQYLSDRDLGSAITFIYSFMVNSFKGAITELLAAGACIRLMEDLKKSGRLPDDCQLYVGDAVLVIRKPGKGYLKGPDLTILSMKDGVTVLGVAEVKSYFQTDKALNEQLDRHIRRVKNSLCVAGKEYSSECVLVGGDPEKPVLRIAVLPDRWQLPRTYHFKETNGRRFLMVDERSPSKEKDEIRQTDDNEWRITLRWSKEAIAAAAYEMTFWYMEKVGEVIYSDKGKKPREWAEMTPAEAGRNAAKMMLYYAPLRDIKKSQYLRAIKLYNAYSFGYQFAVDSTEMLWPEDFDK